MSKSARKILVVDDEESSRYTLSHYLKRAGYQTCEAQSGAEALRLARERPDLVLLDIHLPDMLGYEVCKMLKGDPITANIPVLHVSATFRTPHDKAVGLEGGADGFLSWPVEPEELIANVRVLLRLREADHVLRKRNERLEILSGAMAHLLAVRDYGTIVQQLFSKIAEHLQVDTYLNFVTEGGEELLLHSYAGISEQAARQVRKLGYGEGICGAVAARREPIHLAHIQTTDDPRAAFVRSIGLRAYASNPLMVGEELFGALGFGSCTRDRFEPDELQFLGTVSQHIAIALERLRRETELRAAKQDLEVQVQKRTEKLREAIQEMESFTYSITHDMRAPLRAMQGFAGILLEENRPKLDSESVDRLERIANAAKRLDALIADVLNYSKIVRAETTLGSVDLNRLIGDILRDYPIFQQSRAEIRVSETLPAVIGNEAFLTQVFSNLLGNAIKFVSPGTLPRVEVTSDREGSFVRISVEDNGVGIDPQHQSRIFNLFERLHTSNQYSGTGVGLAIVLKAVQRMGGEVGVQSEPGKGSRFWIRLQAA
jgi:signal transduction histidine kinase/DNA-binding response OmpR family regulator